MKPVQQLIRLLPALALMAVCSAAILFLPQLSRDNATPATATTIEQKPAPIQPQHTDKQA
ncbi:MAG TPA: hypothetical protein VIM12_00865 [Noviherbaspirillum sp.]|jgi:hypothetical protein|uniref:hypothetical protein n=1 Tax=Noviherbaspirillum sp. TaxID=1926288 RepID=UPI002F955BC2